jgi:hypothetical protein
MWRSQRGSVRRMVPRTVWGTVFRTVPLCERHVTESSSAYIVCCKTPVDTLPDCSVLDGYIYHLSKMTFVLRKCNVFHLWTTQNPWHALRIMALYFNVHCNSRLTINIQIRWTCYKLMKIYACTTLSVIGLYLQIWMSHSTPFHWTT